MSYQSINCAGFSSDTSGYSGAFSWLRSKTKPGFWLVIAYEQSFSRDGFAVTDDFGNLVKVAA